VRWDWEKLGANKKEWGKGKASTADGETLQVYLTKGKGGKQTENVSMY
jgi:hypothetical protein